MTAELGGEDALVDEIRAIVAAHNKGVLVGIGDDAAVWQPSRSHRSIITTDALVEGVHFTRAAMAAADVGYRALATNLSDCAAMGARPVLATVALGLGAHPDVGWIRDCYRGLAELAAASRCAIAGGDIVKSAQIILSITVVGEVRPSNLKLRSGMLPGDIIAVTGPLGASRAGLCVAMERPDLAQTEAGAAALAAYRRPQARLREGKFLAASRNVRAMMDLSDGPSSDLARMARASGGIGIDLVEVPIHPAAAVVAAAAGADAHAWALNGGDDYELAVAVEKRAFSYLSGRFFVTLGRELIAIGRASSEPGLRWRGEAVAVRGFDHLAG